MAATDPNPNVDPTITGQEAWFNEDARFIRTYMFMEIYIMTLKEQMLLILMN